MAMDQGGERLDEAFEDDHDATQDWYFDLPSGAWERQEEKNRQLRANLLGHTTKDTDTPKDPFTGQPVKGGGFLGRGRKKDKPVEGSKKPVFERRGSDDERVSRFRALREGSAPEGDSWSTEPKAIDENAPLLRNRLSAGDEPPAASPKGESRWDQLFGAPADSGSIVDGMRNWATSPNDADEDAAEDPGAESTAEPVDAVNTAEEAVDADTEESLIGAMRNWATAPADEHAPDFEKPGFEQEPEVEDEWAVVAPSNLVDGDVEPATEPVSVVAESDLSVADDAAESLMERIRNRARVQAELDAVPSSADTEDQSEEDVVAIGADSSATALVQDESEYVEAPAAELVASADDDEATRDPDESPLEGLRAWAMNRPSRARFATAETTVEETPDAVSGGDDKASSIDDVVPAAEDVNSPIEVEADDNEWSAVDVDVDSGAEYSETKAQAESASALARFTAAQTPVEDAVGSQEEREDTAESEPQAKKPGILGRLFGRKPKPDPAEAAGAAAISAAAWLEDEDPGWGMSRSAATGANLNAQESEWEPVEHAEGTSADGKDSGTPVVSAFAAETISDIPETSVPSFPASNDSTTGNASPWASSDMATQNDSFGWSATPAGNEAAVPEPAEEEAVASAPVEDDDEDAPTWAAPDMAASNDSFGWSKPAEEEASASAPVEDEAPHWVAPDMASSNDSFGWSKPAEEVAVASALVEDEAEDVPTWAAPDMAASNDSFGWSKPAEEEAGASAPVEDEAPHWAAPDMAASNDSFGWSATTEEESDASAPVEDEAPHWAVPDMAASNDSFGWSKPAEEEVGASAPVEDGAPHWAAPDMAASNDSFGWSNPAEEEAVASALVEDDDEDSPSWVAPDMAASNDSFGWSKPAEEEAVASALVEDEAEDVPTWAAPDMAASNDSFGWSATTEEEVGASAPVEDEAPHWAAPDMAASNDSFGWSATTEEEVGASAPVEDEAPHWAAPDMAASNDSFGWSAPTEEEALAEALDEEQLVADSAVDDEEPAWSFARPSHEEERSGEEADASAPVENGAPHWAVTDMAASNDSFGWSAAQTEDEALAEALEDEMPLPDSASIFPWMATALSDDAQGLIENQEVASIEPGEAFSEQAAFSPLSEQPTESAPEAVTFEAMLPADDDADDESQPWAAAAIAENHEAARVDDGGDEWEPEQDDGVEPAPAVPAFEASIATPQESPVDDEESEWDPEGLDEEPVVPAPAPVALSTEPVAASAAVEFEVESDDDSVSLDWDWESQEEGEANDVVPDWQMQAPRESEPAAEPAQLGFAFPGAGALETDEEPDLDAEGPVEATDPSTNPGEFAEGSDWESVAAITAAPGAASLEDEQDEEPDLWAAIAEEAALEGEAGESLVDAPHATVFGQYGTRRSASELHAEYDQQFVPIEAEDGDMEEDVVLRAFEAHAASEENDGDDKNEAFDELLGEHADVVDDEEGPAPRGGVAPVGFGSWAPPRAVNAFDETSDEWEPESQPVAVGAAAPAGSAEREYTSYVGDGSSSAADAAAKRASSRTWVRELVETGLLAILVFLAVRASFQNFKVDGSSMAPTLADGQFLIVNKLVYSEVDVEKLGKYLPFVSAGDDPTRHVFHGPERGDIIVLRDPSNPSVDLIKRVVGMPGDKLEIVDGAVYIDDFRLEEPYIKSEWRGNRPAVIVPEGHFFVMGDNRDNSKDSRSSSIGFIPEDLIIGRAEFSYLPFDRFGRAPNETPSLSETDGRPVLTSQRLER